MKVVGRVLLLAACVLSAYAVPKIKPIALEVSSASGESNINNGEMACSDTYNYQQSTINQQISQQTSACFNMNSQPADPNDPQIVAQVSNVRMNLTSLQTNIGNCLAMTDDLQFVSCVANDNDVNQHLWNNAESIAQNVEGQLNNSQQNAQSAQKNCVNNVLGAGKQNLTNAANAYNKCLENVLKQ